MRNSESAKQKRGKRIARAFPREGFIVRKKDGTCINVKGKFTDSTNTILRVDDADKIIESGDVFERSLPNEVIEEYFAKDVNYIKGNYLPDHYMISIASVNQRGENMRDTNSTTNNFYGEAKNVQIQQGTQNSFQSMKAENEFDYIGAAEIFKQILCNIDSFNLSNEDITMLKEIAVVAQQQSESKTNEPAIKKAFLLVKDIMLRATGSLTASGILHMLSQMGVS